jgi:hypothetical protein
MKEVDDVVRLAEMAKIWRTNRADPNSDTWANALNSMARAYVGMFTRTGRSLTAFKNIRGSVKDAALINELLDIELAANRITYGDVGIIRRGLAWMAGKEVVQPGQDESDVNYQQPIQKKKHGGVVHDYQLPTLNRPERIDDMMGEGIKEALQQVEALRATGREQEAAELERNIERLMMESNQGQDMQMPGQGTDEFLNQYRDRELAGLERTAEEGNDYAAGGIILGGLVAGGAYAGWKWLQEKKKALEKQKEKRAKALKKSLDGYAEGGLVTQDQMQGMMQQLSGVQPTAQARPIIPPLIDDVDVGNGMMLPDSGVMSVDTDAGYAPTMTKKQKEKAKVKAIKKGNKRRNSAPPPTTGILSGF